MKKMIVLLVVLAVGGGVGWAYWSRPGTAGVSFRTARVVRGDLLVTIGATGTLQPEEVVDVGAQVAGKITDFGTTTDGKEVDYGSTVEQGTVLARIDPSLYASDVEQASAMVEQAKANVLKAQADLEQTKAKLRQAEQNWKRAQELGPSRALSATDYDSYKAEYEIAIAAVAVSEASLVQAEKGVLQAEASSRRVKTNLSYCTIKSPVDGVIIDRRVNIGQTVVASLNAPSLFLIAKDLKRMQVWAAVNEADIGNIHAGQAVTFTVDAYPREVFKGEVAKVRLNASMTQNVVTYTVEIITDNSDGRLLPYLTANVKFEVARRSGVLQVPNAALRWRPTPELIAPQFRDEYAQTERSRETEPGAAVTTPPQKTAWLVDGTYVRPVVVNAGSSDGTSTEIESADLQENSEVVIGQIARSEVATTNNPFTPKFYRGSKKGG